MTRAIRFVPLNRISALAQRKQQLEREIEVELQRPMPCSISLRRLKQQRLMAKDNIRALQAG